MRLEKISRFVALLLFRKKIVKGCMFWNNNTEYNAIICYLQLIKVYFILKIHWTNIYLGCNVWLISLKFISHNKLEWMQTSLNIIWFKCMIMMKPYTVCLYRLCWIKGAWVWILCQMEMYTRYLTQYQLTKK